jgi:hypothetical protein
LAKRKSSVPPNVQQVRAFRHKVAVLKRKGLIEKELDARGASITDKRLNKLVTKYDRVIRGVEKTTYVKKSAAQKLKAEGAEVRRVNNKYRVVTTKAFNVNSKTGNVSPSYGKVVNRGRTTLETLEAEIEALGEKLDVDAGDAMALSIFGNDTRTYQSAEVMIQDLDKYISISPDLGATQTGIKLLFIPGSLRAKREKVVRQQKQRIVEGSKSRKSERATERKAAYAALEEKRAKEAKAQEKILRAKAKATQKPPAKKSRLAP